MIKRVKGDVLSIKEGIIVHGCNAQGVMGSGIALQIKERFPAAFYTYAHSIRQLGSISVVRVAENKFIVNAITQHLYGSGRRFVNYEAVAECFERIVCEFSPIQCLPICFPSIGAGLGAGNWNIIKTIIDETISDDYEKHHYTL